MHRLAAAPLVFAAVACSQGLDDRPLELEYLTQAIFAPSCGKAQCHSTFRQVDDVVLDTPEAVRAMIIEGDLISYSGAQYDPDEPDDSRLMILITQTDPFPGTGIPRMPYDAPLPNKDVDLLRQWIQEPAVAKPGEGGGVGFGAQCNPELNNGIACRFNEVVACNPDWNFGEVLAFCERGCTKLLSTTDTSPSALCRK